MRGARPDLRRSAWSAVGWRLLLSGPFACAALSAVAVWQRPEGIAGGAVHAGVLSLVASAFAIALCVGAARRAPGERFAWWAAAAAWTANLAGDLAYRLVLAVDDDPPFPSVADVFWLASYPALFAVPVLFVHARHVRPRPSTWLDGLVGALGATAVAMTVVIGPAVGEPGDSSLATAVNLAYPVADVLLLTLVGAVLAMVGLRLDPLVTTVCVLLVSKFVGDLLLAEAQVAGGYVPGGPLDLLWMANACLTATGAWLAGRHRRRPIPPQAGHHVGWQSLAVPLGCATGALAVLGAQRGDDSTGAGEVMALACLAAFLVRTAVAFAETRSLHQARREADTDDLTGLANRRALMRRLAEDLGAGRPTGLLLLDLDGFKAVNDELGHEAGDELLRRLSGRLAAELRPSDLLARLGGDEFVVLLPADDPDALTEFAHRMADLVRRPVPIADVQVRVDVSIGLALAPRDGADAGALLRCADVAMYAAKTGGESVRWYGPGPGGAPVLGDRFR